MKVLTVTLLAAVTVLFFFSQVSAGVHDEGSSPGKKRLFTKHFEETLFDITEHSAYSIEILLDETEYKIGKDVVGIVVHNKDDGDVEGAEIVLIHRNIENGEQAPGAVRIKEKGGGLYIASGLDLERDGRWELSITVKKSGEEDEVKFIFPDALKDRHPKGRYSP